LGWDEFKGEKKGCCEDEGGVRLGEGDVNVDVVDG